MEIQIHLVKTQLKLLYILLLSFSFPGYAQDITASPLTDKQGQNLPDTPSVHPARTGTHGRELPLQLWSGDNGSFLRMNFKAEMIYAVQDESWFGESKANLGKSSNSWWESAITPGVTGSVFSHGESEYYGELSVAMTNTHGIDAAGSNVQWGNTGKTLLEKAYLGWRSGSLWSKLGKDFLDISIGRQQYIAGNGFLFFSESSNGGKRGGYWLGVRNTADLAALAKLKYENIAIDMIYIEADDQDNSSDPNNNTKVSGLTLDYHLGEFGGIGGGYYGVKSHSGIRDGMDIIDARFTSTPFKPVIPGSFLVPLNIEGEYVNQQNGSKQEAAGWYLSAKYPFDDLSWSPSLTYRYASFEGGDTANGKSKNYDPLFYGFYDWGYWFQGEALGEYLLSNSNLNSNMLRLSVDPTPSVHINMFYYHFELDDAAAFGVENTDFADEWDLTVDWKASDTLFFSLVTAYVKPNDGAREYTGGKDDWYYMMLYASLSFK